MTRHPASLADSLGTMGRHLLEVSEKLKAGRLSGPELHDVGQLLSALAETVHLYADKLGTASGKHTLREPPDTPPQP